MSKYNNYSYLKEISIRPGVYRYLNDKNETIYVGKAKNLKKRVSSYFQKEHVDRKTKSLVKQISKIETTITENELEAFMLEIHLIKELTPKFNIIFRDDKSYPYIQLTTKDNFPGIYFFRSHKLSIKTRRKQNNENMFFGPFANAQIVKNSIGLISKFFKIRRCNNHNFKNRVRPCIEYEINSCSAPCVNLITKKDYADSINKTVMLLNGKSEQLIEDLQIQMQAYALKQEYEKAAKIRDEISMLRHLQEKETQSFENDNFDILGVAKLHDKIIVVIMNYRYGSLVGKSAHHPKANAISNLLDFIIEDANYPSELNGANSLNKKLQLNATENLSQKLEQQTIDGIKKLEVCFAFLTQKYLGSTSLIAVSKIYLPFSEIEFKSLFGDKQEIQRRILKYITMLENYLNHNLGIKDNKPKQAIKIKFAKTENEKRSLKLANLNAAEEVKKFNLKNELALQRLQNLQDVLKLDKNIIRIECFDVSHLEGQFTFASCVVFDKGVPNKKQYRIFKIKTAKNADDYAAMREVLARRYKRRIKENLILPDLIIIDGGKGHLNTATKTLQQLNIDKLPIIAIAKGEGRKAGLEIIYTKNNFDGINLDATSKALNLLNYLRDESHRFAIKYQRKAVVKNLFINDLTDIVGVGIKLQSNLINHFGSIESIANASISSLLKTPGINKKLAKKIKEYFEHN